MNSVIINCGYLGNRRIEVDDSQHKNGYFWDDHWLLNITLAGILTILNTMTSTFQWSAYYDKDEDEDTVYDLHYNMTNNLAKIFEILAVQMCTKDTSKKDFYTLNQEVTPLIEKVYQDFHTIQKYIEMYKNKYNNYDYTLDEDPLQYPSVVYEFIERLHQIVNAEPVHLVIDN